MFRKGQKNDVVLLDFEFAGFWNPTIDLFQFVIHLPEDQDKGFEKLFLESYHARLIQYARVPDSYTYERMYKDYLTYGVSQYLRWVSILFVIAGMPGTEWGADRIENFLVRHNVDIENIPMPNWY